MTCMLCSGLVCSGPQNSPQWAFSSSGLCMRRPAPTRTCLTSLCFCFALLCFFCFCCCCFSDVVIVVAAVLSSFLFSVSEHRVFRWLFNGAHPKFIALGIAAYFAFVFLSLSLSFYIFYLFFLVF